MQTHPNRIHPGGCPILSEKTEAYTDAYTEASFKYSMFGQE